MISFFPNSRSQKFSPVCLFGKFYGLYLYCGPFWVSFFFIVLFFSFLPSFFPSILQFLFVCNSFITFLSFFSLEPPLYFYLKTGRQSCQWLHSLPWALGPGSSCWGLSEWTWGPIHVFQYQGQDGSRQGKAPCWCDMLMGCVWNLTCDLPSKVREG